MRYERGKEYILERKDLRDTTRYEYVGLFFKPLEVYRKAVVTDANGNPVAFVATDDNYNDKFDAGFGPLCAPKLRQVMVQQMTGQWFVSEAFYSSIDNFCALNPRYNGLTMMMAPD